MLLAVIEALGVLRWRPEAIRMLSHGYVNEGFNAPDRGGQLRWAIPASQVFLEGQASGSFGGAYLLLGDRPNAPERLFRLQATAPKDKFPLDGADGLKKMNALGQSLVRHRTDQLFPVFFDQTVEPFVPVADDASNSAFS
jgi:hypothetical protein